MESIGQFGQISSKTFAQKYTLPIPETVRNKILNFMAYKVISIAFHNVLCGIQLFFL